MAIKSGRNRRRTVLPFAEMLEDRRVLSASLGAISNITSPAQLGYQVALDGSGNTDPSQIYSVQSSNPDIQVSIAQGPFWTLNVQHASSGANDPALSGTLIFQLFQDLAPTATSEITLFTNNGYYNGKNFTRIASNFGAAGNFVAQGGAVNPDGSGNSGQPGTPFANEIVQQLAFTGTQQLALANTGASTSNDTQFFVTTGTPAFLDYGYTIFGQMVAGGSTLSLMNQVKTQANAALNGEVSSPISPIVITSASISQTSVNGTIHVNTTSAKPGETATITVTATDPTDGSQVTRTFLVTVGAYNGPTTAAKTPINFVPFATPVTTTTNSATPIAVQLSGQSGFPDTTAPGTLSYQLVSQPANGTISQFNSNTGSFVYTPAAGFGTDTFQYVVNSTGPQSTPNMTTSLATSVSITTNASTSNPPTNNPPTNNPPATNPPTTTETFTPPSFTDLIQAAKNHQNAAPAAIRRMVNALKTQLVSGPLADLYAGTVDGSGFVDEAQRLEADFEATVDQLFSKYIYVGRIIKADGARVVADLISLNAQSNAGLVSSSSLPSAAGSAIVGMSKNLFQTFTPSLPAMKNVAQQFEQQANLLIANLTAGTITSAQASTVLNAEAEAYRADIHADLQVLHPYLTGVNDSAIDDLESSSSTLSDDAGDAAAQLQSILDTFDQAILGSSGLFAAKGVIGRALARHQALTPNP